MQTGRTLQAVAREIVDQQSLKRDFIGSSSNLELIPTAPEQEIETPLVLRVADSGTFPLTNHTQRQMAERIKIPAKHWDRLATGHPDLLAHTVNALWRREPERRLVRTMAPLGARAFLSDRYRVMDHGEMFEKALIPVLNDLGSDVQVMSSEITDSRFYLKCAFPKVEGEIRQGDPVQSGFMLTNSEIGMGALNVSLFITRLICTNGMVSDSMMRSAHLGGTNSKGDWTEQLMTDETKEARDRATWLQLRDSVKALSNPDQFAVVLNNMKEAGERRIEGDPMGAVHEVANRFKLSDNERSSVLTDFIQSGDLTAWGLANAVTQTAGRESTGHGSAIDYDRSTELERVGSKLLNLAKGDWSVIANAKPVKVSS